MRAYLTDQATSPDVPAAAPKADGPPNRPHLSIVMPCYNEEAIVGYTIPRLITTFERAGYTLELVAVDNGSHDRTGEIIHPALLYVVDREGRLAYALGGNAGVLAAAVQTL